MEYDVRFPVQLSSTYCAVTMEKPDGSVFDSTHSVISEVPSFRVEQSFR